MSSPLASGSSANATPLPLPLPLPAPLPSAVPLAPAFTCLVCDEEIGIMNDSGKQRQKIQLSCGAVSCYDCAFKFVKACSEGPSSFSFDGIICMAGCNVRESWRIFLPVIQAFAHIQDQTDDQDHPSPPKKLSRKQRKHQNSLKKNSSKTKIQEEAELLYEKVNQVLLKSALLQMDDFVFCKAPDCKDGGFLPRGCNLNTGSGLLSCCLKSPKCLSCNHPLHQWKEDTKNETWKKMNTKKCSKCRSDIEKDGGCNHMRCSICHHEFCWMCGQNWKNHQVCTYKAPPPPFHKTKIFQIIIFIVSAIVFITGACCSFNYLPDETQNYLIEKASSNIGPYLGPFGWIAVYQFILFGVIISMGTFLDFLRFRMKQSPRSNNVTAAILFGSFVALSFYFYFFHDLQIAKLATFEILGVVLLVCCFIIYRIIIRLCRRIARR